MTKLTKKEFKKILPFFYPLLPKRYINELVKMATNPRFEGGELKFDSPIVIFDWKNIVGSIGE